MGIDLSHHCEQGWADSCVPACIVMVRRSHGELGDEAALYQGGARLSLTLAAIELAGRHRAPDAAELLASLPIWLSQGKAVLLKVCGPVYVAHLGHRPAGQPSRHGGLAEPGPAGPPFHCVVAVARTEAATLVLAPYYPAMGQPVSIPDEVMLEVFACEVVVA